MLSRFSRPNKLPKLPGIGKRDALLFSSTEPIMEFRKRAESLSNSFVEGFCVVDGPLASMSAVLSSELSVTSDASDRKRLGTNE